MGVTLVGHRRRLLDAIAALAPVEPSAEASGEPLPTPAPGRQREAERRQLTVMFVDLVGSTALSQRSLDAPSLGGMRC
jgi:class 3 adenylate cyclase